MGRKTGPVCMIAGAAFIILALLLLLHNSNEDNMAGQAADAVLPKIQSTIAQQNIPGETYTRLPDGQAPEQSYEMTVTEIDGYGYIGYLSIPVLDLNLPVMSEWDYTRLKIAPCRHFGSTKSNDLVIAGHNYRRHFGKLRSLHSGDLVLFTDMDGEITTYAVGAVEVLAPTAIEEVKNSAWDLTLYTCTYGGESRIVVRCKKMNPADIS